MNKIHNQILIIITKELTNPTTIHVDCTTMHLALPLGLHFELYVRAGSNAKRNMETYMFIMQW